MASPYGGGGGANYMVKGILAVLGIVVIGGVAVFGTGGVIISDTAGDHTIAIKAGSDEAANRVVTLPALGGSDVLMTTGSTQSVAGAKTFTSVVTTDVSAGAEAGYTTDGWYNTTSAVGFTFSSTTGLSFSGDALRYGNAAFWQSHEIYTNNVLRAKVNTFGLSGYSGGAVASAAAIVPTGNVFHVTGTADITSITSTGIQAGFELTIIFDGTAATNGIVDGSNLILAGNFLYSPNDTINLIFDGTNFYEISRSVN